MEVMEFLAQKVSLVKVFEIRNEILNKADKLLKQPFLGQEEEYLKHLGLGHRRLDYSHYKIVYRVEGDKIYITDIFDSRQDIRKMKG